MRRLVPLTFLALAVVVLLRPASATDDYVYGGDSMRHDGVPKGKVTPFKWDKSKIFAGTTRDCWVYVPAQYDGSEAGLRDGLSGRRRLRRTRRGSSACRSSSTT